MILELIILFFFAVIVYFDIKTLTVPSVLTTSIILVLSIVNINNIHFGIIAFIFAYMLYEFDFIQGFADIKMIVAIGLMCSSLYSIISMMALITIIGMIYNTAMVGYFNKKKYAFTVVLLICYLILFVGGFI